jgi:hypothetical protein
MKKVLVTLDINYSKKITDLTFPYMEQYAKNIDADFIVLKDRKYPNLPITMEKFQLYDVSEHYDWTIFLDADCLINPKARNLTEIVDDDIIIVSEYLWPIKMFKVEDPTFKGIFNIHSCFYFLCFSNKTRNVVKMPNNPLNYCKYINSNYRLEHMGKDVSWHLDEFILNYNIVRFGLSTVSLKDDIRENVIATDGNYRSVEEKIIMLKENINILNNIKVNGIYE